VVRRWVIFGAGAIGATIGGRLHAAGREVVLVARGAHLEALRRDGLRLQTPESDDVLRVPCAASVGELGLGDGDVVVLGVKTQDATDALDDLAAAAGPEVAVVCTQNGVETERLALRRFPLVYGMFTVMATQFLEPGVVQAFGSPVLGVLDVGRYPSGADERAGEVAAGLSAAGFASRADERIMRFKYAKLLSNVGNALQVTLGPEADSDDLHARAREEALACYQAAGIDVAGDDEVDERIEVTRTLRPAGGRRHTGGSSWQSVVRGTGRIEADYLNGEIVLLGRLHGVPTPVNEALQRGALRVVREGLRPGAVSRADLGL
jgi:2-dehydropantoate 2-reductase